MNISAIPPMDIPHVSVPSSEYEILPFTILVKRTYPFAGQTLATALLSILLLVFYL